MPAAYYLVQFTQRVDGAWVSPANCEPIWALGCFKQIRFDGASGKSLVKCLQGMTLPSDTSTPIFINDIDAWIAGLARQPKSYYEDGTVFEYMTASEEQADAKRIGAGYY